MSSNLLEVIRTFEILHMLLNSVWIVKLVVLPDQVLQHNQMHGPVLAYHLQCCKFEGPSRYTYIAPHLLTQLLRTMRWV